ncbi:hypothetical protein [Botrimarina sp.]|uniref:hypothetical protein n=1 Tax=Botrimarina sp. TaxID=2795802 RepID=UPI0032ED6D7D
MPAPSTAPIARTLRRAALLAAAAALGCEEEPADSVFAKIGRAPPREELVEVELGEFSVPVPVVLESAVGRFEPANLMEVQFRLFAVVEPAQRTRVERLAARNEGRIRDKVITVCRQTPRDDLAEAQWATLKAHLFDAVQPLLGGTVVRGLGVNQVMKEEL